MNNEEYVHVDCYFKSLNKADEELCGDKVEVRRNDDSCIMVLADGLGSGVKANILSTLTSTIISEMIKEGATIDEVVETITATLPECKERHVAYSTFTLVQMFYNGDVKIVEFDNPETIIFRDKQILKLDRVVSQIGNRKIKFTEFKAQANDFILFFSDGIINASAGEVLDLDWDIESVAKHMVSYYRPSDKAKEVVRILLAVTNDLYEGHCGDDCTVACAKIIEAKESCVLVGPPVLKSNDELVVRELISANGKKICCGGTTSQIVARVLEREIIMGDVFNANHEVPPLAYISGIDLVTEGVITLQKVNRTLSDCRQNPDLLDEVLSEKDGDAASLMVHMLMEDCTRVRFIVGCSENAANASIAYLTMSLNAKKRLIQKIAANLEYFGKIVSIEYY